MKQTLLVAVTSAAIGAATATLLQDDPPLPPRSVSRVDAGKLEFAFVRALERMGFGERVRAPEPPVAERAGDTPDRAADAPDRAEDGGAARTPATPLLPAANQRALEDVRSFEKDERMRREWIFRSEKDVIEWLGTPDMAYASSTGERWHYKLAGGDDIILHFHRGRLLRIRGPR